MAVNSEGNVPLKLFNLLKSVPTIESIAAEASDIHRAAVNGDMELLKTSLNSEQWDVNVLDDWGHTPLFVAALKGYDEIVELLISKGAKVNGNDVDADNDSNPLHCTRSVNTMKTLLNAGGNVNAKDSKGNTPLHRAVMREDESVAVLVLEHKANVNSKNNEGCSALHVCCNGSGNETMIKIMKYLIKQKADVNAIDNFGMTPLHYCAKWQCPEQVVRTLVTYGGDLKIRDYRGNCPVHYFRMYLEEDEAQFLETLQEFLPTAETSNVTDMKGQTPLHLATNTSANVIVKLLEYGCHVNARDNQGKTAMHISSGLRKNVEIARKLIANGGNINETDEWGRTPLHEAARVGNDSVAKLLISHKADVNAKDTCGFTPLHESAANDACQVVETLLENGANVNHEDIHGSTPLHLAAWGNNERCVEFLLKHCAVRDVKDAMGQTPLDVALCRKAENVITTLASNGDQLNEIQTKNDIHNTHNNLSSCGGKLVTEDEARRMVETKEIFRKGEADLPSYLKGVLEAPEIGRGCDESEALEIQQCMESFVQTLADKIGTEDWRFRCKLLHAGSTSEGTKTRRPDEFDYIFALEEFSKHCCPIFQDTDSKVQAGVYIPAYYPDKTSSTTEELELRPECVEKEMLFSVSDYAIIEINASPEAQPFVNFAGSTTMPVYKMYDGFSQLVTKLVFSRDFPKFPKLVIMETTIDPAISLRWRGCRYKDLEISVDLVPAIILSSWPKQFSNDRVILTPDILRIPSLVVPKMTAGTDEDLWRCSLVLVETAIFRKLRPEIRNSYVLCKTLISSLFCPIISFGENEEAKAWYKMEHDSLSSEEEFAVHEEVDTTVPSYMLKMMFLAAVESKAEEAGLESVYSDYTNTNTPCKSSENKTDDGKAEYGPAVFMNVAKQSYDLDVKLVLDVFRRCEECIERKFVPSFFNPKHNVLGSRAMEDGAGKAAVFIKFIRCLLES